MQSVDTRGFDDLTKRFDKFLDEAPQIKREFHERFGDIMRQDVRGKIASSLNDGNGKVAGWQTKYVGSGGGYAAIRATDESSGRNSPGAITNYLENGHKVRTPKAENVKSRAKMQFVPGRHFYMRARLTLQTSAQAEIQSLADELAGILEG